MAIQLSDNLQIGVGAPIDNKYLSPLNVPYTNVGEVNTTIGIPLRYVGLTVNILGVEYWYQAGVTDVDLVVKSGGSGSGERIEKSYTQTLHGFSVGDVITYSGTSFTKAIADGSQNSEVLGFVSEIINGNEFTVVFAGYITGISPLSLSPNTTYYLSTSIAGDLDSTNTNIFGEISKPILVTLTNDDALIFQYRGFVITSGTSGGGSTSGITVISNVGLGTGNIWSATVPSGSGDTAQLRTLLGSGGTTITQSGETVIITSDATGLYDLQSPSNVEVGGAIIGTVLTGRTANQILEDILIKVFVPDLDPPFNTFNDDATNTLEVGFTIATINFTATFDQGAINPQYTSGGTGTTSEARSGFPYEYNYIGTGLPTTYASTSLTDGQIVTGYTVTAGTQSWSSSVSYSAGTQPYDSAGNPFDSPLSAGTTSSGTTSINGIYPWFYGKFASGGAIPGSNRPSGNTALISGYTDKLVESSNGTITVPDFTSDSDDYIWFAIPSTSASKFKWYVNALNNGAIGSGGDLFPAPDIVNIDSPDALWSGIQYKIYVSSIQTSASIMEFRNS